MDAEEAATRGMEGLEDLHFKAVFKHAQPSPIQNNWEWERERERERDRQTDRERKREGEREFSFFIVRMIIIF